MLPLKNNGHSLSQPYYLLGALCNKEKRSQQAQERKRKTPELPAFAQVARKNHKNVLLLLKKAGAKDMQWPSQKMQVNKETPEFHLKEDIENKEEVSQKKKEKAPNKSRR